MTVSEIKILLNDFSTKHELVEKALDGCKKIIDYLIEEDQKNKMDSLGGFSKDEIIIKFDHQKLLFNDCYDQSPLIIVQIGLYIKDIKDIYLRNIEPIGYYQLHVNGDGEIIDDVFTIDKEKNYDVNAVSFLREINEILPETDLRRNHINYEYISYVHHFFCLYQSKKFDAAAIFAKRAFEFLSKTDSNLESDYNRKSSKTIKRIVNYLYEDGLLSDNICELLVDQGMIKNKNVG
jgi:hypothetical protein